MAYFTYYQEYIIKREGEYPTPVYPSVVTLSEVHDLYNVIHTCWLYYLTTAHLPTTWPVSRCAGKPRRG